jgi:NAD(P) transhydrogenase
MTDSFDYDFICLGSGPAGQRAAVQAAKLGKSVAIVEKGMSLGGVSTNTGTIPSKTFREAVISIVGVTGLFSASDWNKERVQPTAELLLSRVHTIIKAQSNVQVDQLKRNGIDLLRGTGRFNDPHTIAVKNDDDEQIVRGEHILIGVGTTPRMPDNFAFDGKYVITSDEILKLHTLPRSLVVVGCGVIGIEYASMFAALGTKVTIVEGRPQALDFLDHQIVDEIIHEMRTQNVIFQFGDAVAQVEIAERDRQRVLVTLDSNKRIACDLVLVCAGRQGATDDLNLAAAGFEADERKRIKVDAEFRTETPNIFAVGDIIGYPSLAASSSEQGRRAALHAFGVKATSMPTDYPVGIYAIPEISSIGQPEHELTAKKIPYETGIAQFRETARGQILGATTGFLKLLFHRENRKLLGVHIIGPGATELVHIGQAALALDGGLTYFLEAAFNYPTLAECYKVAALDAYNKITV